MEDSDHQYSVAFIGSNDDLLTEILIRLPVTSILRFKSVSKHWRLLLTHRHFTRRYDNLSKTRGVFTHTRIFDPNDARSKPHCLYVPFDAEDRTTPLFRSLDFYFNRFDVRIIQSCNGLLLCSAFNDYGAREYYVFNPTTKQLAFIPPVHARHGVRKTILSMALAFHQIYCVHYKVVCIRSFEADQNMFQVQVYSSDTRRWKVCIESFSPPMFRDPADWNGPSWSAPAPIFHGPVYWNGAVQWAPYYQSSNHLYFKIDDEQLQMLPVPEGFGPDKSYWIIMYFGESRGHLHLILRTLGEQDILCVNVYEMLRDHSGWFVKYRLKLDALLGAIPCLISMHQSAFNSTRFDLRVVDVVRGKEEDDTFLVLVTPMKMIRYNVHDKSFKELCSNVWLGSGNPSYHRYIETLFSF